MKNLRNIEGAPTPIGPYSPAVIHGEVVYCSGQIGLSPKSNTLVEGGVDAQTRQVLLNLAAVLRAAGSSPEKILMTTIFVANMSDFKIINELYGAFVSPDNPPARQTVAVKELPLGALVEISVIAAL